MPANLVLIREKWLTLSFGLSFWLSFGGRWDDGWWEHDSQAWLSKVRAKSSLFSLQM